MKYLTLFEKHSDYVDYTQSEYPLPNVSWCKREVEAHFHKAERDYSKEYLTTEAIENGTISFNIWKSMGTEYITSISYSTDDGNTWRTINNANDKLANLAITVNVNEGDKVLWKGDAQQTAYYDNVDEGDYVGSFFSSDSEFNAYGNIMSLLYGDNFYGENVLEYDGQFANLFSDYDEENECKVVNAENLSLPATTLVDYCYRDMFYGCTSLTAAPELPATTLTTYCYNGMFYGCTSLTAAPELPATTLANYCYSDMFRNCASLTTAPELPATTLAQSCYNAMFVGCTSLATAPELPATTLVQSCYSGMFVGCSSLTVAPELPATTLADYCYRGMFSDCTNLNYIKAMFTTTPSSTYTSEWVSGVSSTGTFVKNSSATWTNTGVNAVPTGWTVETASE